LASIASFVDLTEPAAGIALAANQSQLESLLRPEHSGSQVRMVVLTDYSDI